MDELAQMRALRERNRRAVAGFLSADLDYGCTLCGLAKRTPERLNERLQAAQKVLDAATTFMWKVKLEPSELCELTAKSERLKFELESLGSSV
jgi:hypothetical protein